MGQSFGGNSNNNMGTIPSVGADYGYGYSYGFGQPTFYNQFANNSNNNNNNNNLS